jgi:hypothetical protein
VTHAQRETFRHSLLEVADAAGSRYGLPADAFRLFAVRFGFRVGSDETSAELSYLTDKGLLAEVSKLVSPELPAWRITAAGRDYLAGRHD